MKAFYSQVSRCIHTNKQNKVQYGVRDCGIAYRGQLLTSYTGTEVVVGELGQARPIKRAPLGDALNVERGRPELLEEREQRGRAVRGELLEGSDS